jgi:hypothetical protein
MSGKMYWLDKNACEDCGFQGGHGPYCKYRKVSDIKTNKVEQENNLELENEN